MATALVAPFEPAWFAVFALAGEFPVAVELMVEPKEFGAPAPEPANEPACD